MIEFQLGRGAQAIRVRSWPLPEPVRQVGDDPEMMWELIQFLTLEEARYFWMVHAPDEDTILKLRHVIGAHGQVAVNRTSRAQIIELAANMVVQTGLLVYKKVLTPEARKRLEERRKSGKLVPPPKKDLPVTPGPGKKKTQLTDLIVHVHQDRATGDPIPESIVSIDGPQAATVQTDATGTASFMQITPGRYSVKAHKKDLSPNPASTHASPPAGGKQEVTLVLTKAVVIQINAKVAGTNGVRKPATDKRADNVLRSSTSADESLAGNAPIILVRGCKEVQLEAVTSPANFPVTWEVKANENTDAPPTITPQDGGRKATLKTNVHGSMSVIATLGGKKVVWNVVFVWVKVDVKSSLITTRDNKYADNGTTAARTRFRSGEFSAGQYSWEAQVDVKVVGGGNSKTLGTDKVQLHCLHNGVADTLSALYDAPGISATEVPIGGLPIRDSNDELDPWMDSPTQITPDNTGLQRRFWTADAPAGGFPRAHISANTAIRSITGVNGFIGCVASVSSDAPDALMVHAQVAWSADFAGTVAAGIYTPSGAHTTAGASFALISSGTGGQDAGEAGFETFEPRFNGGTNTTWLPPAGP